VKRMLKTCLKKFVSFTDTLIFASVIFNINLILYKYHAPYRINFTF
jgi:hypothetical protein